MSIKILLVDDDKDLLESYKDRWEEEGETEVVTNDDPRQAIKSAEDGDFDVIVTDYMMPSLDGLELIRILKEEKDVDSAFVILTGEGDEDVAGQAVDLDVDKYLKKGCDAKELYDSILEVIFKRPV